MSPAEPAALRDQLAELEIQLTPPTSELVEHMSSELELWPSDVEAALFLAGLAHAHGAQPPQTEAQQRTVPLGPLGEGVDPGELDRLVLLVPRDAGDRELVATLRQRLPGMIEAGADLLAPRLEGADAAEAGAVVAELIGETG